MKKSVLLLASLLALLIIAGCAGTRQDEDDYFSQEERQRKELDDIEALLGISTKDEDAPAQTQQPAQKDEKLNLLEGTEVLGPTQADPMTDSERKRMQNKITQLEEQLRQKDRVIADLNARVTVQEQELKSAPHSGGGSFTGGTVSEISMAEYDSRYNEARNAFENRNYEHAITLFSSLLAASSTHSLADNAQYWIGESHYALKRYDAAIIDFEKVLTFANSNKKDDAQLKLGLCYIRKGDKEKAREELNRLVKNYPNSSYISVAQRLLSGL